MTIKREKKIVAKAATKQNSPFAGAKFYVG